MSDTVIALREDCILAAEGKSGARQILAICSCVKTEMHMELRTPVMKNLPLWH